MSSTESFGRPHTLALAAEPARAIAELGMLAASAPLLRRAPQGDGHPVVVLPGFSASDNSTRPLRHFLRRWGYHVHGWRLGINIGPTDRIIDGLARRMEMLRDLHGEKMSLIGWSLGGIYAREIARRDPAAIRQVITLGAPFRLTYREESYAALLYNALRTFHSARAGEPTLPESLSSAITVPVTNIFSRSDGVAPWRSCIDEPGASSENVEVIGSHCGLGHNPAVLLVVADRLAQPEGDWVPYRGSGPLSLLYRAHAA